VPEVAPVVTPAVPAPTYAAAATSSSTPASASVPAPWVTELEVLGNMGFTDPDVLLPLLAKHNGSIIFVMTELLG
jgi:hypothetical protein